MSVACASENELSEALNRIHQALKNEGKLLLIEPIHKGFLHRVLNLHLNQFLKILNQNQFEVIDLSQIHFWPFRLLLAYSDRIPKSITRFFYFFGEKIMNFFNHKFFGDYKVILAQKKNCL